MQHPTKIQKVRLSRHQLHAFVNVRKKNYWEWGRGSGKSTGLSFIMLCMVKQMPRATFALVGETYQHILSKTLPATKEGLALLGIYQDVDYVVGRCGKKFGFDMPFQPPDKWDNIIHFSNGAIFQLVSLDNPNSGRGLNTYAIIADEAALLDYDKLFINVKTTNRAQKAHFAKCTLLGSETYISSTPITKKGKWFTDAEDKAKADPANYYYSKANALSNPFLRPGWLQEMKAESASELIFNAEFLNIRPKEITDGFYANLIADKHYYSDYNNNYLQTNSGVILDKNTLTAEELKHHFNCNQDNDVKSDQPLIVSVDFGVFNSCVVSQDNGPIYNVLKSFWVKSPKLLSDLFIEKFIPYYKPHNNKTIYLYGGHDGNMRLPNSSKTLLEQIEEILTGHGWIVHQMTKGRAASHAEKYELINIMLKEVKPALPAIRINKHNCHDLIVALERTEAIQAPNGVQKDKKGERNKSLLQQHTTHLTDAFDIPLHSRFWSVYKGGTIITPEEARSMMMG